MITPDSSIGDNLAAPTLVSPLSYREWIDLFTVIGCVGQVLSDTTDPTSRAIFARCLRSGVAFQRVLTPKDFDHIVDQLGEPSSP